MNMFPSVLNVTIQETAIDTIEEGTLSYFPNAKHFSFNDNCIFGNPFKTLHQIQTVNLSHNQLDDRDKLFQNHKLDSIDLSYNNLSNTYLCKLRNEAHVHTERNLTCQNETNLAACLFSIILCTSCCTHHLLCCNDDDHSWR